MEKTEHMNKLEKLIYTLGKLKGLYAKGATVNAPIADPTAWGGGRFWGEGLLRGKKPTTKPELVEQFQSWVYICSQLNADTVASTPLRLYVQKKAKGQKFKLVETKPIDKATLKWLSSNKGLIRYTKKEIEIEEVVEHQLLDLFSNVNKFMNGSDLMEATSIFMDLTGEAYWYIIKDKKLKRPLELWPIPSQYMKPIPGETLDEFIKGWEYRRGNKAVTLEPDEIIDFRSINPHNFLQGFSAVRAVADAVYVQNKMYEFEQALFENKARTGSIIESSSDMNQAELDRLDEQWKQKRAGTAKAGMTAILPPGLKVVKDQMTPEELSYIEGRKITREEIAAALDCPISLWDKTAIRANVEAALYFHAKFGILPRLRKIEKKLNERIDILYPAKERGNLGDLFWAFDDPVPADKEFDQKARTENVDSGIISRDEAREEIGKDARGGPVDELYIGFDQVVIGSQPEQAEEELAVRILEKVKEKLG